MTPNEEAKSVTHVSDVNRHPCPDLHSVNPPSSASKLVELATEPKGPAAGWRTWTVDT
jgi:hypothetical protein